MAISVDPATFVITVPEADLTLVQSTPTVIYNLDLNEFHLWLRDWEDGQGGMPFQKTHTHNTEVTLGGINYARIIEIIEPYTITFEDGQYTVNLTGANSNVGDRVNKNQVSVSSNNSAGLISNPAIEYSSFAGGVHIDVTSGVSGTIYNRGTPENPVDNVPDANLIADFRGFSEFHIIGDITFDTGDNIGDKIVYGENASKTTITINTGAVTDNCEIRNAFVTGVLDQGIIVRECIIENLDFVDGVVFQTMINPGSITLGNNLTGHFLDCFSGVPGTSTPTIDMGGSGQALAMRNYNGGIKLTNKTGSESVSIDLNSGQVKLDPDAVTGVTNGTIVVRGVGKVINADTGSYIPKGTSTFNSATVINETINPTAVSEAVWDEPIANHLIPDTTGHEMYHQAYAGVVHVDSSIGSSGTTFPTGTTHNPCDNLTDALAIGSIHSIDEIHIRGAYTITGEDIGGYTIAADSSVGNSVSITSMANSGTAYFKDITVSGSLTGATRFTTSVLGGLEGFDGGAKNCLITNKITVVGSGANYFTDCDTYTTDGNAYKEISIGSNSVNLIRCEGNYELTNKTGTDTTIVSMFSGDVKVASSCVAGSIDVEGIAEVIDESGAGCLVNSESMSHDAMSNAVWDEELTGATHNIVNSAGRKLRQLNSTVIHEGTAQGSGTGTNQIQLDVNASAVDGSYDPAVIAITDNTGVGQSRLILGYDGATKTATVDRDWKVNPDNTSAFIITSDPGREHVNEGLAQGGTSNTITLNQNALAADDNYVGQLVFIRSGTGADQVRLITSYVGATRVATLSEAWTIIPDTTSAYVMLPTHTHEPNEIADAVWDEQTSGHTTSGTFGEKINSKLLTVAKFLGLKNPPQ